MLHLYNKHVRPGMVEREVQRIREAEAQVCDAYEEGFKYDAKLRQQAIEGKTIVRASDRPWELSRQGRQKFYFHIVFDDMAVRNWRLFVHDIRSHSGRHRHQGGLAIYVIEGRGWTIVDGQRLDWEKEDLILLPIKPGGVEHQHFNAAPGKPCRWLGMVFSPFKEVLGSELEQKAVSPEWAEHA